MSAVWKFTLDPILTTLQMPAGAKVLTVAAQDGEVRLWAEVDPDNALETRQFMAVPTGAEVYLDGMTYVGTAFLDDLVFHIYAKVSTRMAAPIHVQVYNETTQTRDAAGVTRELLAAERVRQYNRGHSRRLKGSHGAGESERRPPAEASNP
jgi:hypothetical protein